MRQVHKPEGERIGQVLKLNQKCICHTFRQYETRISKQLRLVQKMFLNFEFLTA